MRRTCVNVSVLFNWTLFFFHWHWWTELMPLMCVNLLIISHFRSSSSIPFIRLYPIFLPSFYTHPSPFTLHIYFFALIFLSHPYVLSFPRFFSPLPFLYFHACITNSPVSLLFPFLSFIFFPLSLSSSFLPIFSWWHSNTRETNVDLPLRRRAWIVLGLAYGVQGFAFDYASCPRPQWTSSWRPPRGRHAYIHPISSPCCYN